MATITADTDLTRVRPSQDEAPPLGDDQNADHGLPRFFYAAAIALLFSAVQGVVQRLPGISDWLRDADYGGHMVSDLAHTHITIVGAGTISLTALIYYVLPRVTGRPLYSKALTNISFWATIVGVFGFYVSMIAIGAYEGAMVHAGWGYEAARDWMGAWHKAPMAITAAIMGIGYWTFVANVYATVGRASGERKVFPGRGPSDEQFLLAKFFVVGATGLLFGTIQGVYQVMPWSLDWLHATGDAGRMIDPMAHAHMNLVGGVSVALMGLLYFFLPKMLGRPIHSFRLAKFSFWCILIGVFAFYFSAVGLGFVEGSMILDKGITDEAARAAVGIWHPLLLSTSAAIMGLGFWSFVANILLTIRQKPAESAPADRKLVFFIGFSVVAILFGTIQGVIQALDPVEKWLDEALPSSYYLTPLAHAQLNMVGFAIMGLMTMTMFVLPRILGKPVVDPVAGRRTLTVMATGIVATYLAFAGVGLLQSIAIHNGTSPAAALDSVGGFVGRWLLFVIAQGILAVGYFMLFRYMTKAIGPDVIRAYFATFFGRMRTAGKLAVRVHPGAMPDNFAAAQRKALISSMLEIVVGLGWLYSGRPFIGAMLLGFCGGGWWTFAYVVLATAGNGGPLPVLFGIYAVFVAWSATGCYRSFMRDAALRFSTAR